MNGSAGEDGFIAWLRQKVASGPGVLLGPGDDCAILAPSGRPLLVSTDMLLEGSCFRLAEAGPYRIGRKAMAVNLSDIAAMAGVPRAAVVSVGLPRENGRQIGEELFRGIHDMASEFDVAIIGGDTNSHDGGLVICITILGDATDRGAVSRYGAKPGDLLFVTGPLGGSIRGHHLDFTPRVREALAIHSRVNISAMMDLSDGLAKDLHRMCAESQCGAVVSAADVPMNEGVDLLGALGDGEDFELLIAIPPGQSAALIGTPGVALFLIGECVEAGLWLKVEDRTIPLPEVGYEHKL